MAGAIKGIAYSSVRLPSKKTKKSEEHSTMISIDVYGLHMSCAIRYMMMKVAMIVRNSSSHTPHLSYSTPICVDDIEEWTFVIKSVLIRI